MVTYYRYRDVLVGTLSMISVERCLPLFIRPFDEFSGIELVFLPLIRYRWKLGIGFDHRFLPFFEFLHLSGYPKIIFVPRDFFSGKGGVQVISSRIKEHLRRRFED